MHERDRGRCGRGGVEDHRRPAETDGRKGTGAIARHGEGTGQGRDWRGQDPLGQGAGRIHVRGCGRPDPARHVRIHGEIHRLAADWLAARVRGV